MRELTETYEALPPNVDAPCFYYFAFEDSWLLYVPKR